MTTILWRPEINALTTPPSFRPRHIPRANLGYDELAAVIERRNPIYNAGLGKGFMLEMREAICEELINGNQISLEGFFTCHISLTGRMATPDDPIGPPSESVHTKFYASRILDGDVSKDAQLELKAQEHKLPIISTAWDTLLKLDNVLNPTGVLQMTGEDLYFNEEEGTGECVITGTESGSAVQTSLVMVTNSMIILVPSIPSQTNPWNNEYRISVTTHYTEHGTDRTGTYERRLRTPLAVPGLNTPAPPETGILTDNSATPYVVVSNGTLTADERLRIRVTQDLQTEELLFALLDMKEDGEEGDTVRAAGNGLLLLPGFSGSAVSVLEIVVNDYEALWDMVRNRYGGILIDVLDVAMA